MNSQLATVLLCGSLDDQHGCRRRAEGPEPPVEDDDDVDHPTAGSAPSSTPGSNLDPTAGSAPSRTPGSNLLQPCSLQSLSSGGDAPSVNGTTTTATPQPACQEDARRETSGINQRPIAAKTGVPVSRGQPIRLKLAAPRRCEQPITNNNNTTTDVSLTKDLPCSRFTTPSPLSADEAISTGHAPHTAEKDTRVIPLAPFSPATNDRQTKEVKMGHVFEEEPKVEAFQGTMEVVEEGEEKRHDESHLTDDRSRGGHVNCATTTSALKEALVSGADRVQVPAAPRGIKVEQTERGGWEENAFPLNSQAAEWSSAGNLMDGTRLEEQTEPLDLTLPKKRESRDRRTLPGRFLDESLLIMEVDEFEGDGDRDVVEEDDVDDDSALTAEDGHADQDLFRDPLTTPPSSSFSTSPFASLSSSSVDYDPENLLLIDDQGIPYTLSPEGRKVPQVDVTSQPEGEDPVSGQPAVQHSSPAPAAVGRGSFVGLDLSQSLNDTPHALNAPPGGSCPSADAVADMLSPGAELTANAELLTSAQQQLLGNSEAQDLVVTDKAGAALPLQPSVPNQQTFQILTNPATNTPTILLLSNATSSCSTVCPQLSSPSGPMNLSLPLSVAQNSLSLAPGTPTMLLLLSSVPASSPGQPVATSTPIAVLDPSTGQLSQIAASSSLPPAVGLPQGVGQAGGGGALGSPVTSAMSHPIIRLSPNNPPVILSGGVGCGGGGLASAPILASLSVPATSPRLAHQLEADPSSSSSSSASGHKTEAISTDEAPPGEKNAKPSSAAATTSSPPSLSPRPESSSVAYDPSNGTAPEAADSNVASSDPACHLQASSETLQLEDHLYFSSSAAAGGAVPPSSPPMGPILPSSDHLDPLDQLDPLSPASSPNSSSQLGPRRVLYCHLCPRVFFYLSDLERHAITHSQKKPHVCQQCGKAFKRSSHLQRHKHIHTGQRNYVCPICAKRFREAGELQRHQRVHTGEKPYQCQLCHTRFAERNTLRRHTKRKHPYHQVALEMLSERRGGGGGGGGGGGTGGLQEEEESAEWYSSIVSNLDNSEAEAEDLTT